MSTAETLLTIAGMVLVTLLTRGFFILPSRELPLPTWLREGLRYAPIDPTSSAKWSVRPSACACFWASSTRL